jgi:hypothetical protein
MKLYEAGTVALTLWAIVTGIIAWGWSGRVITEHCPKHYQETGYCQYYGSADPVLPWPDARP